MFSFILNYSLRAKIPAAAAVIATALLLTSCVSYDLVEEGRMETPYLLNGATVLLDPGEDKIVVLGARNDSDIELKVRIRPIGGKIGYSLSGSSNYGLPSSNEISAGYLTTGNDAILGPGEETSIIVYLNNWSRANLNFSHRMEIIVDNGIERHAINIQATQDDIFDDAAKTFQDNKLGKNDFSGNSSVNFYGAGSTGRFRISIPVI
jgi:hypothetical protein